MLGRALLILPLALLVGIPGRALSLWDSPGAEEYAVYSAVLGEVYGAARAKLIVIRRRTVEEGLGQNDPAERLRLMRFRLSPYPREVAEDFIAKNAEPSALEGRFSAKAAVRLVSEEEIEGFWRGWEAFRKKFPHSPGLVSLSRVGFNSDSTKALVFTAYGCGSECGEGYYVLLAKREGRWVVEDKYRAVVA